MIYSLKGTLVHVDVNFAVIECSGVGYRCTATHKTLAQLPDIGEQVLVFTYMAVREDSIELFGFATLEELDFFKMVISVNGIGPKLGISILSDFTPEQLAFFITAGDAKSISKANGVGAKTAQRIVLELKDKIAKSGLSSAVPASVSDIGNAKPVGNAGEAIEALVAFGFTQGEAAKAVAKFDPQEPVEKIIKEILKSGL